jgi:hypothetical protein
MGFRTEGAHLDGRAFRHGDIAEELVEEASAEKEIDEGQGQASGSDGQGKADCRSGGRRGCHVRRD